MGIAAYLQKHWHSQVMTLTQSETHPPPHPHWRRHMAIPHSREGAGGVSAWDIKAAAIRASRNLFMILFLAWKGSQLDCAPVFRDETAETGGSAKVSKILQGIPALSLV